MKYNDEVTGSLEPAMPKQQRQPLRSVWGLEGRCLLNPTVSLIPIETAIRRAVLDSLLVQLKRKKIHEEGQLNTTSRD